MRRKTIADWTAGVLAVAVLALGGLVVVKPAVDHWDDLYRGDPFRAETTTQTVERNSAGKPAQRTTTTTRESASFVERALGKGGLLLLRIALLALAAFLAAAVLHRVLLASYGFRSGPGKATATSGRSTPAAGARPRPSDVVEAPSPAENGRNGDPETNGADLASSIGKFVSWRREELGLSQRELGKRAGVSHTVISRLESGQQVPSPKTLERLAEAFRADRN